MKKKTKATRKTKKEEDSDEGPRNRIPTQKRPRVVKEINLPAIMDYPRSDAASTWQDRLNSPKADHVCPHLALSL